MKSGQTKRAETDNLAHQWYDQRDMEDAVVAAVEAVAAERSVPPSQVALAWVAGQSGVTAPIIGASKPHHLKDVLAGSS